MRAMIDPDICTGCELCVQLCSEVFEMRENVAAAKVKNIPAHAEECCEEAAENCPVSAIEVMQ